MRRKVSGFALSAAVKGKTAGTAFLQIDMIVAVADLFIARETNANWPVRQLRMGQ